MTRMSIDVPNELHKMIKFSSTIYDQTIREFVVEAIRDRLAKEKKFNASKLTKRTMEKSDRGEDVHMYKSYDAFLAEMGIK